MTAMGSKTAIAANQPANRNSMFPEGYLKVLGFIDQPDREWYETIHAPDFLSFAQPHLDRYARNWVTGVRHGAQPAFSVLTEIHFASELAKLEVRGLMATPAARPLLDHTMEQRAKRGVVEEPPPPGLGLFAAAPEPALPKQSPSPVSRQAILLRRAGGAEAPAFARAAKAVAMEVAGIGGVASVMLDLVAESGAPADAVVYVAGAGDADVPVAGRPELELVAILDVETVSSVVGGAAAS